MAKTLAPMRRNTWRQGIHDSCQCFYLKHNAQQAAHLQHTVSNVAAVTQLAVPSASKEWCAGAVRIKWQSYDTYSPFKVGADLYHACQAKRAAVHVHAVQTAALHGQ